MNDTPHQPASRSSGAVTPRANGHGSARSDQRDRILIVCQDAVTRHMLVATLENAGGFETSQAASFQDALDQMLVHRFALAVVEANLPDLSGIDLLTAASALHSYMPTILIDDQPSAKAAVSAFRLGAIDYICKPVNLDFFLMRVEQQIQAAHVAAEELRRTREMEARRGPAQPAVSAALLVQREQFTRIAHELSHLYEQIQAYFVGLVDTEQNLIGSAGRLQNADLILLVKALSLDPASTGALQEVVGETTFQTTHFEGDRSGVYIIEFGRPLPVSLVVICPVDVKLGMVWHYSKRTALVINQILEPVIQSALDSGKLSARAG